MSASPTDLRIVQLVKGLDIGGLHGGADVFGVNLACAQKQLGVDARCLVFFRMNTPNEQRYLDLLTSCGVEVVFLETWSPTHRLRAYWNGMRRLVRFLRREQITVLHSHFHVGSMMAAWFRLTRLVSTIARTVHVDREWLRGWESPLQQIIIRLFIFVLYPLLFDIECGVSAESVMVLNRRPLARLFRRRAQVIYNGIPAPDIPTVLEGIHAAGPQKDIARLVIGTIGRLTEQKGHAYLLQAVPRILERFPQAEFWWIGDGPLRASLETAASDLGLQSQVRFFGVRDDVSALYQQMDLFVLPSLYEGLPTVVLESMAHGVPVIATDIPGTREIIQAGKNGLLVPPAAPLPLADAILRLLQHHAERTHLAQAALASLERFTMRRAAEQYLARYQEATL